MDEAVMSDDIRSRIINCELTLGEVEYIINVLLKRPFEEVHELIPKLISQTNNSKQLLNHESA